MQSILDEQQLQQLAEIGFMAAGRGFGEQARAIFDGLAASKPESEVPAIGIAVLQMCQGDPELAATTLRDRALRLNPDSDHAKCFLGMALRMAGRNGEATGILEDVAANSGDETVRSLADGLLRPA